MAEQPTVLVVALRARLRVVGATAEPRYPASASKRRLEPFSSGIYTAGGGQPVAVSTVRNNVGYSLVNLSRAHEAVRVLEAAGPGHVVTVQTLDLPPGRVLLMGGETIAIHPEKP